MAELGRILIADDEETFLYSTADLLREEGYECDCASDSKTVIEMVTASRYDVLITDINMPGNSELELLKDISKINEGMAVILVTGYPSVNSAIRSIQLRVVAYMVKPLKFDELLAQVKASIERTRTYHAVCKTKQRLEKWGEDLGNIEKLMGKESSGMLTIPINTFFMFTLRNITDALLDLKHLTDELAVQGDEQYVCERLECSRLTTLKDGLAESVEVLEKTKRAFKSKDLGILRRKLKVLVEEKKNRKHPVSLSS